MAQQPVAASPRGTPEQREARAVPARASIMVVGDTGIEPVTSSVSGKRAPAAPIARADDGTRTRDPHLGKVMLYQLSHIRTLLTVLPNRSVLENHSITITVTGKQHRGDSPHRAAICSGDAGLTMVSAAPGDWLRG